MRVLFRVAAGPRIGFGHLVRCRSLARALNIVPTMSVRGSRVARSAALAREFDVSPGGIALLRGATRPDVLVVDDPSARQAAHWVQRARELRVPVATLHDLGIGYVQSDLAIDGSIEPGAALRAAGLCGPMYAVLDPSIAAARMLAPCVRRGILIALGGGEDVHRHGSALAAAILDRCPGLSIRIVEGFSGRSTHPAHPGVQWVSSPDGLADELRHAAVAVVAGGLTLYEAAALGTPSVAMAVVAAQQPTVRAFARRAAVVDAGIGTNSAALAHVADAVVKLIGDPAGSARLGAAAARLVDGHGVFRAADAILQLADRGKDSFHAA